MIQSKRDVIPPGLAKRYQIRENALQGFMTYRRNTYPYSVGDGHLTGFVNVELRVLTYDITDRGGSQDVFQMLKNK